MTAEEIIQKFELEPHPEGGFYKRTFQIENKSFSSILFLLEEGNFSAFHRITSDEQWNWYCGDAIMIHEIDSDGNYSTTTLTGEETQMNFQHVVKSGHWFASECIGDNGFALCGCTVIPAFSFDDFMLGDRSHLIEQFPQHSAIIDRLTK